MLSILLAASMILPALLTGILVATLTPVVGSASAHAEDALPTHGNEHGEAGGDGFWNVVDGFSTKTGYRLVWVWDVDEPIAAQVQWGYSASALDYVAMPLGDFVDTAGIAILDVPRNQVDSSQRVHYRIVDLVTGTSSPLQSFPMGNAYTSDFSDGVYEVNALLQLDAEALPDDPRIAGDAGLQDLSAAVDVLAERVWDMTDGYVRLGKVVVTDTNLNYPFNVPFGTPIGFLNPPLSDVMPGGGICAAATPDAGPYETTNTLADFLVETAVPADSHTFRWAIDHPCTPFYIGRQGWLRIPDFPWRGDLDMASTMAHEFGHYALGLDDLYPISGSGQTCFVGTTNAPDNANGDWDISVMSNTFGWYGTESSGRWRGSELDRATTPCPTPPGALKSWPEMIKRYQQIPAQGRNGDDRPDHSDSVYNKPRGNPDGGKLDIYVLDHTVGMSKIDHAVKAPEEPTGTPALTITTPAAGATVQPTTVTVAGTVNRLSSGVNPGAPVPTLTASPTSGPAPLAVEFSLGATDPDGDALASWTLDFGDGSAPVTGTGGPAGTASHTYTTDGNHRAILSVTDDTGATGEATVVIRVGASGKVRIGTDPLYDLEGQTECATGAVACNRTWVSGAAGGLDLSAAYVEDVGDAIRFTVAVGDGSQFFVDPSGDPESGASRITGYSLTVRFSTSPGTIYTVNIDRARGSAELTGTLGKRLGVLIANAPLGAGSYDAAKSEFSVDVPKSQFPEIAVLSTLQGLQASSAFKQQGAQVQLIVTMDANLQTVENGSYNTASQQSPLGLVRAPDLAKAAPTAPPANPEIDDASGDVTAANAPVDHMDLQAAWFDNDAENLYIGLKIKDIPADPTTTSQIYYGVNFKPAGVTTWPGVPSGNTFTGLRVTALLSVVDFGSSELVRTQHRFALQHLSTSATGSSFGEVAALPASSVNPSTDIIWFVVPRTALAGIGDGATLETLTAASAPAVGGLVTFGSALGDSATSARTYVMKQSGLPLTANAGGAYTGVAGAPVTITGSATGGAEPYGCAWSSTGAATFADASACTTTVTYPEAGSYQVTLTVTDADGTQAVAMAGVNVAEFTLERVDLFVNGATSASASAFLSTSAESPTAAWQAALNLAGLSGETTLTARWYDGDETLLDEKSVTVIVSEGQTGSPYVAINQPQDNQRVTDDTLFVSGVAGHGEVVAAPQSRTAFGGLFAAQSTVTRTGDILTFCATCQGGPSPAPATLAGSTAWQFGAGGPGDGVDGLWLDVAGLNGAQFELSSEWGSPMDVWWFASDLDGQSAAVGKSVSGAMPKTGTVPDGANWAFVYMRRPTQEGAGNLESVLDTAILDLTPPTAPLSAPRNLQALGLPASIRLSWQAPESDGGSPVTNYQVWRDGAFLADAGSVTTYEDAAVTTGTAYTYTVLAQTALATSPASNTATATAGSLDTTPPTQVTGVAVVSTTSSTATLSWQAASDDTGVAGYRVYVDGLQRADVTTRGTTIASLAPATTYSFTVAAYDAAGNVGMQSQAVSGTTQAEPIAERLEIYLDGALVATLAIDTSGGEATWGTTLSLGDLADGTHLIEATFVDAASSSATDSVTIVLERETIEPFVAVTSPSSDGAYVTTPTTIRGVYSTDGRQPAGAQGTTPAALPDELRQLAGDAFVAATLRSPSYPALLDAVDDVAGYLGAFPAPSQELVVILSGAKPADAPASALGIPLRYAENQEPQVMMQKATRPAQGMSLEEFELWAASPAAQGPYAPLPQSGVGPGTAIQQRIGTSTFICTASFLYEHPTTGKYYLGTAGHCLLDRTYRDSWTAPAAGRASMVSVCVANCIANFVGLGTYVDLPRTATYEPVAFAQQWNTAESDDVGTDFGLIEIPDSLHAHLRPYMYFWGSPTGEGTLAEGDPLVIYGHGYDAGTAQAHQRAGVNLGEWNEHSSMNAIYSNGGDSGSAIASAFPRADKLLFGDRAVGTLTHGLGLGGLVGLGPSLGIMMGTHHDRGLDMVEARLGWRPVLVTEDAEIRAPGGGITPPAPEVLVPETGTVVAAGALVDIVGTADFLPAPSAPGTATQTFYLHRTACGTGQVLYMDTARSLTPEGGDGCGSLAHPIGPVWEAVIRDLVDIYPANPAPAEELFLDTTRPVLVEMFTTGFVGEPLQVHGDFEARLTTDGGSRVLASKRMTTIAEPYGSIEMALDWADGVTSVPAGADLAFAFYVHQSTGMTFFHYGGDAASHVVVPLGQPPARGVQVSVGDAAFGAQSLLSTAGTNEWVATWDTADVAPGTYTLHVRSLQNGEPQGSTTLDIVVADGDVGPTAAFTRAVDGLTASFRDTSVAGNSPIVAREWSFGDGATSTDAEPTHAYAAAGTYTATLTVTDGVGRTSTATRLVDVAGAHGWTLQVRVNGATPGEWTTIDQPASAEADAWAHTVGSAAAGTHTLDVRLVRDGTPLATATRSFQVVNVNHPPVLAPIGGKTVDEAATLAFTVSATDRNQDPLTYTATGLPAGAAFDAATRAFTWAPSHEQAGAYDVTFTVTDGQYEDRETIRIHVLDVNRAPVIEPLGSREIADGETLEVLVRAADPDGDAFLLDASGLPDGATFTPVDETSGTFRWTPDQLQVGAHLVTFNATDARGATSREDLVVLVGDVERAPVFAPMDGVLGFQGDLIETEVRASDPDGADVTLVASGLPEGATFTQTGPGVGTFSWRPTFSQAGRYDATFTADDGTATATGTLVVNVAPADGTPGFMPVPPKLTRETAKLNFYVAAYDPKGDRLTYSVENAPRGAVFHADARRFSWTPDYDQAGTYNVTFVVRDAQHTVRENATITVLETNRAPTVTGAIAHTVLANRTLAFALPATDADGHAVTYALTGLPTGATHDAATNRISWRPVVGQIGNHTIGFVATDGQASVSGNVTVQVLANAAPSVVIHAPAVVDAKAPVQLLANATDPDGGAVTFEWDFNATSLFDVDATGATVETVFTKLGNHTVTVRVTDEDGFWTLANVTIAVDDWISLDVQVRENPGDVGTSTYGRAALRLWNGTAIPNATLRLTSYYVSPTGSMTAMRSFTATTDASGDAEFFIPRDTAAGNLVGRHVLVAKVTVEGTFRGDAEHAETSTEYRIG